MVSFSIFDLADGALVHPFWIDKATSGSRLGGQEGDHHDDAQSVRVPTPSRHAAGR
jgi:hypothetical protein